MGQLADSLVSSSSRRLRLRVRGDLVARRQFYQGREYWVLKDPLALTYIRMEAEEYSLLRMLDGRATLDEIKEKFEAQFRPQKISLRELHHHVGVFHKQGLLIADGEGQASQLRERAKKKRRMEWLQVFLNIMAIRLKGIDPDRLLNWLYPKVRWFFTPIAVTLCVMLGASALMLVLTQFDTFRARLPEFHEFFAASNWFYLAAALAVTKVIHEFGHGLLCKHFGGECHEMGVLLLCLTPCLYCNVSDSWLIPSKWKRAAIGAGGMYVELVMASLATFLWWFSAPGVLHELMLAVMFVCSVSTLVFNANPLLRYDGYYIVSDLLEIPNLRTKANLILQRKAGQWCLGIEHQDDPMLPRRNHVLFAIYSVASFIYGWLVVFGILFFLNKVFAPYGLKIVGQALALAMITGMFVQPLTKLWQFVFVPGRMEKVNKSRFFLTKIVVAVALLLFAFMPLPHRVFCSLEITPQGAQPVYVSVSGALQEVYVRPGQRVKKGEAIARLRNVDLEAAIADLKGKFNENTAKLAAIRAQRDGAARSGDDAAAVRETLAAIETELKEKQGDLERLNLLAPADGVVLAPPQQTHSRENDGRLPTWSGTPLDRQNVAAWLDEGTLFCQIGDPNSMKANLFVDQSDVEFVVPGQALDLKLDQLKHSTFTSRVDQVAHIDAKVTPKQLSHKVGGNLQTKTDSQGVERPESASYQASALISDPAAMLRPGLRGEAKIHVGWQSLGSRFARYLSHTFNFKL